MKCDVQPYRDLWVGVIYKHKADAIGIFKIPNEALVYHVPDLKTQYERIRKRFKDKGKRMPTRHIHHRTHAPCTSAQIRDVLDARDWFVKPYYDGAEFGESKFAGVAIDMLGWGCREINRTHAFIQEAITLEKKLFEEFGI